MSNRYFLDFELALFYFAFLKVRDMLLKSMSDVANIDINSISLCFGDENGK